MNSWDFIKPCVLAVRLRDLYLLDKRAAACRSAKMDETIKRFND